MANRRQKEGPKKTPSIAQLLAVIAAYNKAHELDLAEFHASSASGAIKNEFLENLYFAAADAAAAIRPLMKVELKTVPSSRSNTKELAATVGGES